MDQQTALIEHIRRARIVRRPRGNPGGRPRDWKYKDVICAFDIETSRDFETEQSFIYSWGFCCDNELYYIEGSTWEDFLEFMEEVKAAAQGAAIPVYVHSLSYEFVFASGILDFEPENVICGKAREIMKAYKEPFEFRCSYKLTGLSLDSFTAETNVKHKKLSSGEYNHNKTRYPWTRRTAFEKAYQKNDVVGLVEAIRVQLKIYGDTIYTIPLTQTGYVRREIRKRMKTYPWKKTAEQKISYEVYELLSVAMRGGNCHGNRYYSGDVVPGVDCWDISSAYPAAAYYCDYPMGKWFIDPAPDVEHLIKIIYARNQAVVTALKFTNIRTKRRNEPFPYISATKSEIPKERRLRVIDNGRVLSAASLYGVFTDIDLDIIFKQYDFDDVEIIKLASCKYGKLPNQIREYIAELYDQKTRLKHVNDVMYNAKKREINGIYGLFAEDPGKIYYKYKEGEYIKEDKDIREVVAEKVEKSPLSYSWGVWTTAHVRKWIQDVLDDLSAGGPGSCAYYVDTDGIKSAPQVKKPYEAHNKRIAELAKTVGGLFEAVDSDGVIHSLGFFEREKSFDEFITLGAKKYAYSINGEIKIATAGVNKEKGGKELGSIEKYDEGFTFVEAAGREAVYNDNVDMVIVREGREIHITRNVTLKPSTHTLGRTEEYRALCNFPSFVLKFKEGQNENNNRPKQKRKKGDKNKG